MRTVDIIDNYYYFNYWDHFYNCFCTNWWRRRKQSCSTKRTSFVEWVKDKLKHLSNALKRLAGKAVAALPRIIGSVFGAVLNFLTKAAGFAATHVCTFITFVVGLVATWVFTQTTRSNK